MKKIIEFKDEVIEIKIRLGVDHSESLGVLHNVSLMIPSYGDNMIYGSVTCDSSRVLSTINELTTKGMGIISFADNESFLVNLLKENGFE